MKKREWALMLLTVLLLAAAQTAYAQEAAGMEAGGGGGVTHFSAGGSGRGDRGILVGPQISQACRQLTLQEESIAACRRQLSTTFSAL